jgi:hypothetical protein
VRYGLGVLNVSVQGALARSGLYTPALFRKPDERPPAP